MAVQIVAKRCSSEEQVFMKRLTAGVVLVGVIAVAVYWWSRPLSMDQLNDRVDAALKSDDLIAAESYARERFSRQPDNAQSALDFGLVLIRIKNESEACDILSNCPNPTDLDLKLKIQTALSQAAGKCQRIETTERSLRQILELQPENLPSKMELSALLASQGRSWEARKWMALTLPAVQYSPQQLLFLAKADDFIHSGMEPTLQGWLDADPSSPGANYGMAQLAIQKKNTSRAIELLEQVIEQDVNFLPAHGALGLLHVERGHFRAFDQWHHNLPGKEHPLIWHALARGSEKWKGDQQAIACYIAAVQLDPLRVDSLYACGRLLQKSGDDANAKRFLDRAAQLEQLSSTVNLLADEQMNTTLLKKAVPLFMETGRFPEAYGWAQYHLQLANGGFVAPESAAGLLGIIQLADAQLIANSEQSSPEMNPANGFTPLESASLTFSDQGEASPSTGSLNELTSVRFEDRAKEFGVQFRYENGHNESETVLKMNEFIGGGAGILDYDRDGWPDLYLAQGGTAPLGEANTEMDQLYRNQQSGRAVEVSHLAGINEQAYSHGVAVGDINNDGFPDLYIANIGSNQLFLNNGDGTFTIDESSQAIGGDSWSVSNLIADLDGDGNADLVAVNYLEGDDVFTKVCHDKNGTVRSCKPPLFPAAMDQVHFGTGNGTYVSESDTQQIELATGRGLGVMAAQLNDSPELELFVANDGEANHFYSAELRNRRTTFTESALVSGLAYDREGRPQACMGIACGDIDGDHLPDLFVTNYYHESNTLYRNSETALFVDETISNKLRDPSWDVLGFGTAFIDADQDGDLDLAIANGHEGDYSDLGVPFEMKPQLMLNQNGVFQEMPSNSIGDYFTGTYLGRGMARLDWNRDRREDLVITHLDSPVALLINEGESTRSNLTITLTGTEDHRDAIGATVKVTIDGNIRTQSLTAGDGYLTSHERTMFFSVGNHKKVDKIEVHWRNGTTTTLNDAPTNSHWHFVQSQQAYSLLGG